MITNFTVYRGRHDFDWENDRFQVYYNLRSHRWSIKALTGKYAGKVIGHCDAICIQDAQFVVGQAGRRRVLRERQKNVHAYVRGKLAEFSLAGPRWRDCYYNPYKTETFITKDDGCRIDTADMVFMACRQVFAAEVAA